MQMTGEYADHLSTVEVEFGFTYGRTVANGLSDTHNELVRILSTG